MKIEASIGDDVLPSQQTDLTTAYLRIRMVTRLGLWTTRSPFSLPVQFKRLHLAPSCSTKSPQLPEPYEPPVDHNARWENIKSGEKTVALWALGSAVVGWFALRYMSKVAANKASTVSRGEHPVLVIAGPSGCGKSTLLKKVFDKYPDKLAFSISHTTRSPRQGETDGREYYFTTRKKMEQAIEAGKFIEWAEYSGNLYGTSVESVQKCQKQGKVCVLDIDMQGVRSIKKTELSSVYVHIKPPSLQVLEERLRARETDTEDAIQKRLETAKTELAFANTTGVFDHIILNDVVQTAFSDLDKVVSESFGLSET